MTDARIPFGPLLASSAESLAGASPVARNVIVDGMGVVRRRPGLSLYSGVPEDLFVGSHVGALHETMDGKLYAIAMSPGASEEVRPGAWSATTLQVFRVTEAGKRVITLGGGSRVPMVSLRPKLVETERLIVIANGNSLLKLEKDSERLTPIGLGTHVDENTPQQSTHVVRLAGRLLATDQRYSNHVRYSAPTTSNTSHVPHMWWRSGYYDENGWIAPDGITEGMSFSTAGALTAEVSPDEVRAIESSSDMLFVFGAMSLQLFVPDVEYIFAPAGTLDVGIGAPYSVIREGSALYWFDNRKRIVRCSGGDVEVLSDPISKELASVEIAEDGFGYCYSDRGINLLVWTFPTDGRTFVLQEGVGWSLWGTRLESPAPRDSLFRVTTAFRRTRGPETLVATMGGRVAKFDHEAQDDLEGDIVSRMETGFIDHGTSSTKASEGLTLVVRRGTTKSEGVEPTMHIGYRDRPGSWTTQIPVSLGRAGDTEAVVELGQQGVYQRRQWFYQYSGPEPLELVSAIERVTVI